MAFCEKCGNIVAEKNIVVIALPTTRNFPGSFEEWCRTCAKRDGCDEDYERAEASDAWQRRGGGGL
jgi:hypothetical protein